MSSPDEYDYLVVGAGTAGCVLAARLSQDPDVRVCLLEAGGREQPQAVAAPSAWPTLQGTEADWADTTVPQQAAGGRQVPWPRGRGLGGSSAINAMNFLRGHRSVYDAWDKGDAPGWGYDDLLPYFMRSENVTGVVGRDPAVRGTDGPLRVGPAQRRHPVAEAFLRSALAAGHREVQDLTAGLDEGFGWGDLSIAEGRRQDAVRGYLEPAADRPRLDIVTDALVLRVLLDGRGRCEGVEYARAGDTVVARAARDVVLCAGAVGSPQILLLSGVGPAQHLRESGVTVTVDLPGVGANLQEHPVSGVVYESARAVPPGVNNHGEVQGFLRSAPHLGGPDLQLQLVDVPLRAEGLPGPEAGEGYTILCALMTPYSRGSVRLAGPAPGTPPLIDPGFYDDDRDLDVMVSGLRAAREVGDSEALREWRSREVLPGPALTGEAELRACLRSNLKTYSHSAGTCRIGGDGDAVVDTDLRVHGVAGLRVADASVMPLIPSANTNAVVYAIAERAAELIAAGHRDKGGE
ncbi:GMC family oxidoreductase [Streptomyces sp. NPDC089424]|uniref:GMC family oxidoreductase n=1 Tax=Streptomyces sp. NPDC089424 TaxID=3365917 RepID=UPI0037F33991